MASNALPSYQPSGCLLFNGSSCVVEVQYTELHQEPEHWNR